MKVCAKPTSVFRDVIIFSFNKAKHSVLLQKLSVLDFLVVI
jgi:hypothetical protein